MLALLLPHVALAWNLTGSAWAPEDLPVAWYMDDDVEESLPEGYDLEIVQASFDNWENDAPCAGVGDEYLGRTDLGIPDHRDTTLGFWWNDPGDEAEVGVLGVTYPWGPGDTFQTASGVVVDAQQDADIVFNNDVDFGTTEDILSNCTGEIAIEGVATHEIGHLWGLDHSCEQGESCPDPLLQEATMFWSTGPCSTYQIDLNQDDIDGLQALYSVYGTFAAVGERRGGVPFDVDFEVTSDAGVLGVDWAFGDGETSSDSPTTTHTYTTEGQFSVTADIRLESSSCGELVYSQTEVGYVTACDAPHPTDGADGLFQIEAQGDLIYRVINHTDTGTYGCVDTIEWQVYEGGDVSGEPVQVLNAWAPDLELPGTGTYTVVMNVGGPGGIVGAKMTIDAQAGSASGCATAPAGAGVVGLLAAAGLAFRRRRA